MQYFCSSRADIGLCGSMLFQYVNLLNLKGSVQVEAIRIVRASHFPNKKYKMSGLIEEYKEAKRIEAKSLSRIFKNTDNEILCFAACSFLGVSEPKKVQNVIAYSSEIGLNSQQRDYLFQYFKHIGIQTSPSTMDRDNCKKCFLKTECIDGYEYGEHSGQCWKKIGELVNFDFY